jgi:hypothetical protein
MNPDLFITIAFSSLVFLGGITAAVIVTVMVVRSHRRAAASPSLPAEAPEVHSRQPMAAPAWRSTQPEPSPVRSVPRP